MMDLYFLDCIDTLSGLTDLEKALAISLRTFDSSIFNENALKSLVGQLQGHQDGLMREHPEWKPVEIRLNPAFGTMYPSISIGQHSSYYAWCVKIPQFRHSGDVGRLNTIDMKLYYLNVPYINGAWTTEMERELTFRASSFDKCVFDEDSLAKMISSLQADQCELLSKHPNWAALEISLEKNSDTGTRTLLKIGRISIACREVYHFYADPDNIDREQLPSDRIC